jgi:hypothetical protein
MARMAAETISLVASTWPGGWIGAFSDDPHVLATGATYLRTVGLMFCFYCTVPARARAKWSGA